MAGSGAVGFVGVGRMGRPMSARLRSAGFDVRAFDTDRRMLVEHCRAIGADCAEDLDDLGGSERLITMLPGSEATSRIIERLAELLAPGAVIADMGSSRPTETVRLARLCAERGVALVDAPVSGGVSGAERGTLTVMVGGEAEAVERLRPLLEALGGRIVPTGGAGSGHAMKALNNLLSAIGTMGASEVLLIGRRFGLDPRTIVEVLNGSSGRNDATERKLEQFVLSETYGSGFALELMLKDVLTALNLADETGTVAPLSHSCAEEWASAMGTLGPGADHTEVARWLEDLSSDEGPSPRASCA